MANREAPSFFVSIRFALALIAFVGYATQYTQKINMSVAIVCMVNNTALPKENKSVANVICDGDTKNKTVHDGPFAWSKDTQGLILSAYFFGYLITEIPGGWMSLKFGSKIVLAISIFTASIFTIALPYAADMGYITLIVCRFIVGLAHGVIWPAFSGFWAAWAPTAERSRLIGLANAGSQIGNVIALPLGGYLCGIHQWRAIFFVFGGLGIAWSIAWILFAANSPSEHRCIGSRERDYIEEETRETIEAHKEGESGAPWLKIMTSRPCIAIFIGHSCSNWGTYLFLTSLPSYMKEVLRFDIKSNGALSALPYLMFWLFIILSGMIGDIFIKSIKKREDSLSLSQRGQSKFNKTLIRKIFNSLGLLVPMCAVIGLVFVTCSSKYIGVALLTIGLAFTGCAYGAGFLVNYNDIAGAYSGIVFGIGNTFATIPGIIAPYLVGFLTKKQTPEEWRIVFLITAAVYLIGAIVLLIMTSAEVEPWATKQKSKEEYPLNQAE